jgi:putative mRNA 3-end processing factor
LHLGVERSISSRSWVTMDDLIQTTDLGLYCPAGDFYIDPWQPVPRAVITHAHGDHARSGSAKYLTAAAGRAVLQARLEPNALIESLSYGESLLLHDVRLSFHPAGHILGSSQVRIEHRDRTTVVSGDYKVAPDRTCAPFEPLRCDVFVTESTFGLPVYRWPDESLVFDEINRWWQANAAEGRASLLFAYSLGKAQRVLSGLDPSIGTIYCHGAVQRMNEVYRATGVELPPTIYAGAGRATQDYAGSMILAPPSARNSPWLRRFGDYASAFASGWMRIRGARRRRAVERGFVLSDHADWPNLIEAVAATGARRILVTHGSVGVMVRHLQEQGYDAAPLATAYEGEQDEVAGESAPGADDGVATSEEVT